MTRTKQSQKEVRDEANAIDPDKVNDLLDRLIEKFHFKNDAALARALEFGPPVISKLRHGILPVRAGFVLRAHEKTGITTKEIREILNVPPGHNF